MNEQRNFAAIPASACRLAGGEIDLGDNGDGAKTAPVKLKARSGQPIEHWFWGRVVHDLAGMRLNKPRLTVDYAHNDSEVLGYLNHFDTESGDLIASGALTPFRDDDRASEVLFKMRQGVPYEASIFFGGDGIKVEDVGEGMVAQVNGYQFDGPGLIIREWPLRGVAICPYGADQNTESAAMSSGETYTATEIKSEGDAVMKTEAAVEVEVIAEAPAAVEALTVEAEATQEAQPETVMAEPVQSETEVQQDSSLTVLVDDALVERERLTTELAAATGERDALRAELEVALAEVADAKSRLAAIESGQPPLSAAPAPEQQLTPWQKAQKAARK